MILCCHSLSILITDTSLTVASVTAPTTNAPTTTTTDLLQIIENTTTEGAKGTTTSITDTQQPTSSTTINTIKDTLTCSQGISIGSITGVAIGGVVIGVLLTLIATLVIAAIAHLTKNKKAMLTLLAVNKITQGEDEVKDMEMKNVEEPAYSVVLPNPTALSNHQIEMNMNECYATTHIIAAASS